MIYWIIALALMIVALSILSYSFGFNHNSITLKSPLVTTAKGFTPRKRSDAHHPIIEWLQQNGFSRSPIKNALLLMLVASLSSLVYRWTGVIGGSISFLLILFCLFSIARWRRTNIKIKLNQQLPSFIDQVNRRIKVGMSVQQAIEQSSKTTSNPLRLVLDRVTQRKSVGIELQDAFHKESTITGVHAFRLLGSIFSINTKFGGSIADSLESLVKLLRQQDLSRRELKSITGETRITAWVIGSAPILVGAYMMAQNPDLILNMWYSEKGRYALILGALMQSTGVFLIWRMFRTL